MGLQRAVHIEGEKQLFGKKKKKKKDTINGQHKQLLEELLARKQSQQ